ncbi:muts domain V-domain-containing protein [Kockovaella imperatae]|uniref:DNA mismatch repair protein MSH2 n=1 Tax=Kockovaella imperatae TaxID=4999 RepID=A0A1Y1USU8_9TREE|nr:muts domain V-domain-containing protein [Kockovaella imperatae]ORX41090.1 muts domain V-domain-containing protein [Kockovaella imperatae]
MPMYSNESTAAPKPQFEMDKESERLFCKFVDSMPQKPEGMVRLFDRGDYYSAHGSDALLVAQQVYRTNNVIKYLGSGSTPQATSSTSTSAMTARGLPSVSISQSLTTIFLRECLTTKQMRVEIYQPENGAGGRKNHARWILAKSASPGHISQVEDMLFNQTDLEVNAVSMALRVHVKDGQRTVGCAFADVQEKILGVAEFAEDEAFGNTESLLIQLGIRECVLQTNEKRSDHDLTTMRTLVERCGIMVTELKSADFKSDSVEQDLRRLLNESHSDAALPEFDLKHAMSAMAALTKFLSLASDSTLHGQFRLHRHDLSQYMKLDASALKALNLMPNPQELGGSANMSLYGLLNRCYTSQGKRLLGRWLKQPLINLHEINKRQGVIETFFDDSFTRQQIQKDFLKAMPDLHRLSKKFHRKAADLQDVVRVYQAVQELPKLKRLLEEVAPSEPSNKELINEIYLAPLTEHIDNLAKYLEMVEETIDLAEMSRHNIVLRAELDADLQRVKEKLIIVRDGLDEEHARVGQALDLDITKKLHLENHQVYRYSFRITKAEQAKIRGNKEYIDLSTQKSGSIFTTRTLRDLSDEYFKLQKEYNHRQRDLVVQVVGIAATYTSVLELLDDLIASIDVSVSLAHVSANAPVAYVRPRLTEMGTGDLIVRGARHPCLEVQDDIQFISNDHIMRKDESEFAIVTGPNMGGKSTYIRQIGVIALMAQIGCFVPADEAQLPVFDCVLARVGAGDSQLKGVSTFMAEMLETATILRSATKSSLIIIDELGRGTSTHDGFGLAWAISEDIANRIRCFCLFATHFHELTTLESTVKHVKNLHVEAHVQSRDGGQGKRENDITLLYKVSDGICDQSFGIHVAELANFPESVVKLAKRKAAELEDFGDASEEPARKFTKEETEEGTALVKAFLDEWKSRIESGGREMSHDEQVAELKKVGSEFRSKFEASPWVADLLEGF